MSLLDVSPLERGLILSSLFEFDNDRAVVIPHELGAIPPEATQRLVYISSIRHGEPNEYADTLSGITPQGKDDLRSYAYAYLSQLLFLDKPVIISDFSSPVLRAVESISVVKNAISSRVLQANLDQISFGRSLFSQTLDGTGTLRPLIDKGVPKERAYLEWINADQSFLKRIGAKSPEQVYAQHMRMLIRFWYWSFQLGEGPIWSIQLMGHETGNGAIFKSHLPTHAEHVGFAGESELSMRFEVDGIYGKYQGQEICIARYHG